MTASNKMGMGLTKAKTLNLSTQPQYNISYNAYQQDPSASFLNTGTQKASQINRKKSTIKKSSNGSSTSVENPNGMKQG